MSSLPCEFQTSQFHNCMSQFLKIYMDRVIQRESDVSISIWTDTFHPTVCFWRTQPAGITAKIRYILLMLFLWRTWLIQSSGLRSRKKAIVTGAQWKWWQWGWLGGRVTREKGREMGWPGYLRPCRFHKTGIHRTDAEQVKWEKKANVYGSEN